MTASARRGRRPSTPDVESGDGLDRRHDEIPRDIPDADPASVARTIVLNQLSVRARSRAELEQTLAKRAVPDDVAAKVLDRMTEVGLIDDVAYAHDWVRIRHAERGLARRALAAELRRKGIDDELAREALDTVDPADERARAVELVERKVRTMHSQPAEVQTRRLLAMLARKGYGGGVAYDAIREVLADRAPEAEQTSL